jgi:hypothetical protein
LDVIARHQPGKCICVGGVRAGQSLRVNAEVGQRPFTTAAESLRPYIKRAEWKALTQREDAEKTR